MQTFTYDVRELFTGVLDIVSQFVGVKPLLSSIKIRKNTSLFTARLHNSLYGNFSTLHINYSLSIFWNITHTYVHMYTHNTHNHTQIHAHTHTLSLSLTHTHTKAKQSL